MSNRGDGVGQGAPDDLWTAGFFNERFPSPVSPLGWDLVGSLVERIALREPLAYLGSHEMDGRPILKLYQGHPYARVAVLQTIYKPFPEALVPEDASRYFPGGDLSLRRRASYPCCLLDPRMLASVLVSFARDSGNWWPWGNYRLWAAFARRQQADLDEMGATADGLAAEDVGDAGAWSRVVLGLLDKCRRADEELLRLHRWSLTHADLAYTALRRMLAAWLVGGDAARSAPDLVHGLPNCSLSVDRALSSLADLARGHAELMAALAADDPRLIAAAPEGEVFRAALELFLREHGHRSFSLDIWRPTFRDDPAQVLTLVHSLAQQPGTVGDWTEHGHGRYATWKARLDSLRLPWPGRWAVRVSLGLARRYLPLREDQRYLWQRSLAMQRRLYLALGQRMASRGELALADDVFFLTSNEVRAAGVGCRERARQRREEHARQTKDWQESMRSEGGGAGHYPAFLSGDAPLAPALSASPQPAPAASGQRDTAPIARTRVFRGRPVSPGTACGPARLITGPDQLEQVQQDDVLVVASTDPAWTPIFGVLAALVMERGGQLSHGAVVAREYGLPAVAGLPGMLSALQDGDWLEVDGSAGTVTARR